MSMAGDLAHAVYGFCFKEGSLGFPPPGVDFYECAPIPSTRPTTTSTSGAAEPLASIP